MNVSANPSEKDKVLMVDGMRDTETLKKLLEMARKANQEVPQSDIILKITLQAQAAVLDKGPAGQGGVDMADRSMAEAFRRSVLESMRQ